MSGWNTIQRVRRLEAEVDKLGFKFKQPKHGDWDRHEQSLSLVPKEHDALPIYSRDAELFVGSLEDLEMWLHGVHWARNYDMLLGLSNVIKRGKKESLQRQRNLLQMLKNIDKEGQV
jgi:hypothetical protein